MQVSSDEFAVTAEVQSHVDARTVRALASEALQPLEHRVRQEQITAVVIELA